MRSRTIFIVSALLALGPALGGCENFDVDKLDLFHLSDKKKLPGERKSMFPEGVPGAGQGIPPDLVKGYKPPEVAEETPPPEAEKPKPAAKPRVVRRAPKPTAITVQPDSQPPAAAQQARQPQQAQQQSAWPDPKPQPPQAGQPAWPAPPPSTTFQR